MGAYISKPSLRHLYARWRLFDHHPLSDGIGSPWRIRSAIPYSQRSCKQDAVMQRAFTSSIVPVSVCPYASQPSQVLSEVASPIVVCMYVAASFDAYKNKTKATVPPTRWIPMVPLRSPLEMGQTTPLSGVPSSCGTITQLALPSSAKSAEE